MSEDKKNPIPGQQLLVPNHDQLIVIAGRKDNPYEPDEQGNAGSERERRNSAGNQRTRNADKRRRRKRRASKKRNSGRTRQNKSRQPAPLTRKDVEKLRRNLQHALAEVEYRRGLHEHAVTHADKMLTEIDLDKAQEKAGRLRSRLESAINQDNNS